MKRPRRPVAPKAKRKPKKPTFRLQVGTKDDPLYVDPATIPTGFALQWVNEHGNDNVDTALDRGWSRVKNVLPVQGQVLLWATTEHAHAQRDELIAAARKQFDDANELFQIGKRSYSSAMPIAPPSFMVSTAYEVVPADVEPIDVEVKVKLRLSRRFQDAAAALKLSVEEYAQRRMSLYVNGSLGGLLLPVEMAGGDAVELHETGNFQLNSRI